MKSKLLLLTVLAFTMMYASGQTFLYEDFSSGMMPPDGWSINGLQTQWSISSSSNAGGVAPEAKFSYVSGTSTTRLISPVIDLTGITTIHLTFTHFYDWYSNPAPKLGVATRANSSDTWTSAWEVNPTGNIGPVQFDLSISNTDVGSSEFQFCFYLNGNMYNIDYWYVDNVMLISPLNLDGFMNSLVQTPAYFSSPTEVKGTLMNLGATTITSAEIDWQLDGGEIHTSALTGLSIGSLESYEFTCTDLMNPPIGEHSLVVWLQTVNGVPDDNLENNSLEKTVSKVCYSIARKPLYEEFTSSTCAPCASFNTSFVPWCNNNENDISLLKYQMNWPGSGDPYYTEEGGVRRDYYGVSWVPWLVCNGKFVDTDVSAVQAAFDDETSRIGMMDIEVTHHLAGHIITVNAAVLPFTNIPGCHLFIAVAEKVTHNNVASNGETSFEHVMMKMVPDADGIAVDLVDRTPFTYTNTIDLTGTNVEEWNDLMVVAWVQDDNSKDVYQSGYSLEDGVLNTENRLSDIQVDGNPLNGFNPDNLTYNIGVNEGTTIVPTVQGIPFTPIETVIVIPALSIPGTTTIDVFAENNVAHNQYAVNILFNTGIAEPMNSAFSVYPNPASEYIFIYGAEHARISLYNASGEMVQLINDFKGNKFSLKGITKGVYSLKVEQPNRQVITKKVVVL
jgi:hypothetical protein